MTSVSARAWLTALAAALLFGLQGMWAAGTDSQTWDEGYALATSLRQAELGDRSLVPENPPGLGWLLWPALAGVELPDPEADESAPRYGKRFLYDSGNDHRSVLLRARASVVALGMLAVVAVVRWAFWSWGLGGAMLAGLLCAFEPNWLAHGHLVAWDGIATATMALAACGLARMADRVTLARAVATGLALGAAWLSKHTALLLWPCWGVVALWAAAARWRGEGRGLRREVGLWLLAPVLGLVVVALGYRTADPGAYLQSIRGTYELMDPRHRSYLLGEFRQGSAFPQYYLVALLAKTPLGFLPLLPLGLVAWWRCPERRLALPALLLVGYLVLATAFNSYNLGIRHIVPMIPGAVVLASGAVLTLARRRGLVWVLALLGVLEVLPQAPQYLAFFNGAIGGPRHGLRVLDDSNIDWGQDLYRLAALQRQEGLPTLALNYRGTADPVAHGVDARPMSVDELLAPRPGTVYAISAHVLLHAPQDAGPQADWLHLYEPWAIAGRSLYVYRF